MLFLNILAGVAAQVTTTASTSASVAPAIPKTYTEWEVVGLVIGGFVTIAGLIGGGLSIWEFFRKRSKERREEEQEKDAPLIKRIDDLEKAAQTFRSKEELADEFGRLDEKFKHYKSNSDMKFENLNTKLTNVADQLSHEREARAKIEAQVENIDGNIKRIESAIDRQGDRMEERFDKIQNLIMGKAV